MAGGRPTNYLPEYAERAIQFIGEEGKSVTQFARELRVSRKTIYNWAKDNPEFLLALEQASDWSQAFWEDKLEEMMYMKEVNSPLVKLYFANRFRWTDKAAEDDEGEKKAEPLTITIGVRDAKSEVEVVRGES